MNGALNFTGQYSTVGGTTGLGYADFVTGQFNAYSQGRPFYDDDKSDYYGLYVQDAWRVSCSFHHQRRNALRALSAAAQHRRLCRDVQHEQLPEQCDRHAAGFESAACRRPAGLVFAGNPGYPPNQQYNRRAEHFLPRIGLVWDPFGNGKTSIRVSYGLLYDTPHMFFYTRVGNNPPWGATTTLSGEQPLSNPWATYPGGNPFVTASSGSGKSSRILPFGRHLRRLRSESWFTAGQYLEPVDPARSRQMAAVGILPGQPLGALVVQPGTRSGTIHSRHLLGWTIRFDRRGALLQHRRCESERAKTADDSESDLGTVVQHHRLSRRRRHWQLQRDDPLGAASHGARISACWPTGPTRTALPTPRRPS